MFEIKTQIHNKRKKGQKKKEKQTSINTFTDWSTYLGGKC